MPPADSTAAISTASVNEKASPTSRPATTRPASVRGSPGMCWPCSAIGVRPMEMPTATIPRTCAGMIAEENSGASTNSGVTRASTSTKPARSLPSSSSSRCSTAFIGEPPRGRGGPWARARSWGNRSRAHHRGDRGEQRGRVGDELPEHPRAEHDDDDGDGGDLRDQREALLLDLRDRLEDADEQPDDERHEQQRSRDLQREAHRLRGEADDGVLVHQWKLWTRALMTRSQPSTRTNSRILKGSEMKVGGSMIMPMLISTDETIRSMIRNGRKMRKPIWKAVFSSETMNAGISTSVGTSARVCGSL